MEHTGILTVDTEEDVMEGVMERAGILTVDTEFSTVRLAVTEMESTGTLTVGFPTTFGDETCKFATVRLAVTTFGDETCTGNDIG
jgi:hypothetical protein